MSSSALQEDFGRDGYVTVESVLEASEVSRLRDVLIHAFEEPPGANDDAVQRIDAASRYPAIRTVFERPELLSALRALLAEELIFLPDTVAHDSGFPTWHKDTTTMARRGHSFQEDPRFLLVHVGFYLQDNGHYGGGLDVIPGSHLQSDPFVRQPRTRLGQVIDYRVLQPLRTRHGVSVPTRAGDALVFDFRIAHRATLPTACSRDDIPREHRKLAIFLSCTGSREMADTYRRYLIDHGGYGYLEDHQYPTELQQLARDREIVLA